MSAHTSHSRSDRSPKLPILIIPGFMSSGLEVHRSSVQPSWTGRRVWINLASLGFQKVNFHSSKKKKDGRLDETSHYKEPSVDGADEDMHLDQAQKLHNTYKNTWIQHMALSLADLSSEHPDVEIRPMEGLAAVDYLTPGALTDHVSYVFGPVIKALQKVGYKDGVNLTAAPYDWRLAPVVLEERHEYFSQTMKKVEKLYENNNKTPVVLVCHSLGCKVGHYFLNFAERKCKGWAGKYVHTYMPVGGPHLGAPKALRACITGDKMGLDVFLSDDEATAIGRSFGSGPWLIPETVPTFTPPPAYIRREGAFEISVRCTISDVNSFFQSREAEHWPSKLRLMFKFGSETVVSRFAPVQNGSVFIEQKFAFSTGPDGPNAKRCCCCRSSCCRHEAPPMGDHLFVYLCEPGLQAAKQKGYWKACSWSDAKCPTWLKVITCWWIIRYSFQLAFYCVYFWLYQGWVLLGDWINKASDGSSILAAGEPLNMHDFVDAEAGRDVEVELLQTQCCMCCKKRGAVTLNMNVAWISPDFFKKDTSSERCNIAEPIAKDRYRHLGKLLSSKKKDASIVPTSGYDIVKKERNDPIIRAVEKLYDADPLDPRGLHCSRDAPPVKNVKAIYGINLPTEVGAVYKRRKAVIEKDTSQITHFHKLDTRAHLERKDKDGYIIEEGIVKETASTPQMLVSTQRFRQSAVAKDFKRCSGDGTVPYWSLQHVRTWENSCSVSVTELEGAEHREILADRRFHDELVDYVTIKNDQNAEEQV